MIARWLFTFCLSGFLLVVPAISTKAATIAVTSTAAGDASQGASFSLGYRFTVDQAINVTAVGRFDRESDGNEATSTTAIFNWDTGVKIFETSLAGAALENTGVTDTHFLDISPVLLTSGTNYLLATQVDGNDFAFGSGIGTIVTFDSTINWIEGRATPVGVIAMPATATTTTFPIAATTVDAYFGPNFKFELAPAAVPEPATFSVAGAGLLILSLFALCRLRNGRDKT